MVAADAVRMYREMEARGVHRKTPKLDSLVVGYFLF